MDHLSFILINKGVNPYLWIYFRKMPLREPSGLVIKKQKIKIFKCYRKTLLACLTEISKFPITQILKQYINLFTDSILNWMKQRLLKDFNF